ncbi:hypothetical protein CMI47_11770 [Candidatus Pacearchaeota archaeon]|nr:hypothetical protein [Candidatus Pacearchaeota archaeon]
MVRRGLAVEELCDPPGAVGLALVVHLGVAPPKGDELKHGLKLTLEGAAHGPGVAIEAEHLVEPGGGLLGQLTGAGRRGPLHRGRQERLLQRPPGAVEAPIPSHLLDRAHPPLALESRVDVLRDGPTALVMTGDRAHAPCADGLRA